MFKKDLPIYTVDEILVEHYTQEKDFKNDVEHSPPKSGRLYSEDILPGVSFKEFACIKVIGRGAFGKVFLVKRI